MINPNELVGKTIAKVEIGKDIAFIRFADGTSASVAHDGNRINMMHLDNELNPPVDLIESWYKSKPVVCPECGGENLAWDYSKRGSNGIVDGRFRIHDIQVEFFLGCNDCSETIRVIPANKIANFLTEVMENEK